MVVAEARPDDGPRDPFRFRLVSRKGRQDGRVPLRQVFPPKPLTQLRKGRGRLEETPLLLVLC